MTNGPDHEAPFAAQYAAEQAVDFAEAVFDLDLEFEDNLDWASRIQARIYAPRAQLYRCLPPGLAPDTRRTAERLLAHA